MALTPQQIIEARKSIGLPIPGGSSGNIDEMIAKAEKKFAPAESRFSDIGQDIAQTGQNLAGTFGRTQQKMQDITQAEKSGQNVVRSFGQRVGAVAGGISSAIGDVFTGGVKAVLKPQEEKKIKQYLTTAITPIIQSKPVEAGMAAYERLKTENPALARDLEGVIGVASLATDLAGLGIGKKVATQAVETTTRTAGKALTATGEAVGDVAGGVAKTVGSTVEKVADPEKIMQTVARIPKSAQSKFERTSGESVGSYLLKRNIFGDEETIAKQLFDRFSQSKNTADDAIAQLEGQFKPTPVKTALEELIQREIRVSSPGAISPDLVRTRELLNKFKKDGLTMSEINEVKRLFERNVRLDFVKQNLPEGVARATNVDNALRNWQFKQAEKLGLQNLPEINKETRLAKELLDSFTKEISGSAGNNIVTLTDWILLAGGDPASIAGFLGKKAFSSKRFKSFVAEKLYKGEKIGSPEAKFGEKRPDLEDFLKKN